MDELEWKHKFKGKNDVNTYKKKHKYLLFKWMVGILNCYGI